MSGCQRFNADGKINDARDVVVGATNASLFAYVADGEGGLKVIQLTSPESQPKFYGFSPDPKPQLIACYRTREAGVELSKGLDRDRAVDETGNQIAVFGRRGARPLDRRRDAAACTWMWTAIPGSSPMAQIQPFCFDHGRSGRGRERVHRAWHASGSVRDLGYIRRARGAALVAGVSPLGAAATAPQAAPPAAQATRAAERGRISTAQKMGSSPAARVCHGKVSGADGPQRRAQ